VILPPLVFPALTDENFDSIDACQNIIQNLSAEISKTI
jgi:hypothetical protein